MITGASIYFGIGATISFIFLVLGKFNTSGHITEDIACLVLGTVLWPLMVTVRLADWCKNG